MSNKSISYKGYLASIDFSIEDGCLVGRIEHIRDSIVFGADTLPELVKEFHSSVDDYLDTCTRLGKEPDKPFKGSFNVRVTPQLHKEAAYAATACGETLNQYVSKSIENRLSNATNINLTINSATEVKELTRLPIQADMDWLGFTNTMLKGENNVRSH